MKKIWLMILLVVMMLPVVFAETCDYSKDVFNKVEGVNIKDQGVVKSLFGSDSAIKLSVTDTGEEYYFNLVNYTVSYAGTVAPDKIYFIVTTNSCTLDRLNKDGDALKEYKDGNIKVKGQTAGKKTKMFFGKVGFWFYNIFN